MYSNAYIGNYNRNTPSNIRNEELMSMSDVARALTTSLDLIATSKEIEELFSIGCQGVVLETITLGNSRYTSLEALARFCEELAALNPLDWPICLLRFLELPSQN